ncbi:cuticle protein AM1199-like [Penaeus japonicus]|uniref:cuticle protein AM1199-like n=1 Tax=Penaeus japonicus TaxID=27405 RepID=UPI001C70E5BE|nr:cuticle protein AM1199-like [Penaeus japonicus]
MKAAVVLLLCMAVGVIGRPQEVVEEEVQEEETPIEIEEEEAPAAIHVPILVDIREPIADGAYSFRIEQGDGISRSESAAATGPLGQMETVGEYTFTHPDGTLHHLRYTAGVGGFLPESDMLPTPHPLEPWHLEQIAFAEEQRRLEAESESVDEEVDGGGEDQANEAEA